MDNSLFEWIANLIDYAAASVSQIAANQWAATGTWALVIVAILGFLFTGWQVFINQRHNRAVLLLDLITRYNELTMDDKYGFIEFLDEVDTRAKKEKAGHDASVIRSHSMDVAVALLSDMEANDYNRYNKLIQLLKFAEYTGYVVKRGYVSQNDVINTFGGVLLGLRRIFLYHVQAVQEKPGTTGRAWEYSVWLFNSVQKVAEKARKKRR